MNITQEIKRLRAEWREVTNRCQLVGQTLAGLEMLVGIGPTLVRSHGKTTGTAVLPMPGKRVLSPAGRKAIAIAQKARWAKARAGLTKKAA
jgi:hypothetical protein